MTSPTAVDPRTDAINAFAEQVRRTVETLKATDLAWLIGPAGIERLADQITRRIWTAALTEARHELERVFIADENSNYWKALDAINVVRAPLPVGVGG